jgi:hypothetical protein
MSETLAILTSSFFLLPSSFFLLLYKTTASPIASPQAFYILVKLIGDARITNNAWKKTKASNCCRDRRRSG